MLTPLIRFSDLIINMNCILQSNISTYAANNEEVGVSISNICPMLPESSIDGETELKAEVYGNIKRLEFERDSALTVRECFVNSGQG
jgi:hypothetical protein